jgi:aminopeptidase
MNDSFMKQLARNVVHHSLQLSTGQRVLIDVVGQAEHMVEAMIEAVYEAEAQPFLEMIPIHHLKSLIAFCTQEQIARWSAISQDQMRGMDAYIGIRSDDNMFEMQDLPPDRYQQYVLGYLQPKQYAMAGLGKWILLRNPTPAFAQMARMSQSVFMETYARACNMNYKAWAQRAQPLVDLLQRTDRVRIVSPNTDLSFSVQGMNAVICDGKYNLPDGEVFTAPIADSAHGVIAFNVPTSYMGLVFDQIQMTFHNGRVVEVKSPQKAWLEPFLHQDEGASQIGEFGIGLNPHIQAPMNNLLFDEKMHGSLHLALGQAYPMADNGNRSAMHWDFVLSQSDSLGGGELYLDEVLARKNGLFVLPELMALNP